MRYSIPQIALCCALLFYMPPEETNSATVLTSGAQFLTKEKLLGTPGFGPTLAFKLIANTSKSTSMMRILMDFGKRSPKS